MPESQTIFMTMRPPQHSPSVNRRGFLKTSVLTATALAILSTGTALANPASGSGSGGGNTTNPPAPALQPQRATGEEAMTLISEVPKTLIISEKQHPARRTTLDVFWSVALKLVLPPANLAKWYRKACIPATIKEVKCTITLRYPEGPDKKENKGDVILGNGKAALEEAINQFLGDLAARRNEAFIGLPNPGTLINGVDATAEASAAPPAIVSLSNAVERKVVGDRNMLEIGLLPTITGNNTDKDATVIWQPTVVKGPTIADTEKGDLNNALVEIATDKDWSITGFEFPDFNFRKDEIPTRSQNVIAELKVSADAGSTCNLPPPLDP